MAALEQEIASVTRFILDSVPGITPYYWDIPEGFVVPSVFFPQPELTPLGDTFASYAVEYDWYIRFFASTDEDAYASAAAALNALCAARLLVPLIDETSGRRWSAAQRPRRSEAAGHRHSPAHTPLGQPPSVQQGGLPEGNALQPRPQSGRGKN